MSAVTESPARGWYPDPKAPSQLRWWDGERWTDHRTAAPATAAEVAEDAPEAPRNGGEDSFRAALAAARAERRPAPPVAQPQPPPAPVVPEPEPVVVAEPEPEPAAVAAVPVEERAPSRLRVAAGVVAIAAVGAGALVLALGGSSDPQAQRAARTSAVAAGDRACLTVWNQGESTDAAPLRVTLGQFAGAPAKVSRVAPLPGTLMQPDSCALTVFDPGTGAHAIFVAGVRDRDGYLDVTSYPRASQYGWPKTRAQGNVTIQPDGTLEAIVR
jgi:hypothetical protein